YPLSAARSGVGDRQAGRGRAGRPATRPSAEPSQASVESGMPNRCPTRSALRAFAPSAGGLALIP
ncbi:hypothetical protein ACPW96_21765, partial [Micromonospora sp. DT81.3]|uniref:hypothetical protein n=1 Tax=Micromonospora sp. DT81.3 TaxID=3416523 RepID=UPI003CEF0E84